jgi:hypothetical protein
MEEGRPTVYRIKRGRIMAEGGTTKAQLEKVTKQLEAEVKIWDDRNWNPGAFRMGNAELYVRCEVIAIYKLMRDKLGITEDEFTLYLRTAVLESMQQLRKQNEEMQSAKLREDLTRGIHIIPPKNLKSGDL